MDDAKSTPYYPITELDDKMVQISRNELRYFFCNMQILIYIRRSSLLQVSGNIQTNSEKWLFNFLK